MEDRKSTSHAKWYAIDGQVEKPAYNEMRVATPHALTGVLPNQTSGGIFTLSRMSWGLIDIQESSAFKQATTHMYQEMRKHLGSNMAESLKNVRDYLSFTLEIAVRVKLLERNLAYQFKFSATNPEMPNIFSHVAVDPFEVGTNAVSGIKSFITYEANPQGDDIAATELFWIKAIKDCLKQDFIMPKKFIELASWMFGGVFIDQYAVNKQYYLNDVRRMRLYDVSYTPSDKGITAARYLVTSDYDPCINDTPKDLYNYISRVKEAYAILIADLDKIKTADWACLDFKNYIDYKFEEKHDVEMLSLIDNAYTTTPRPANATQDYTFRVDLSAKSNESESLGVCNAVAYISTLPKTRDALKDYFSSTSPFTDFHIYEADAMFAPISQTALAAVMPGANIPAAVNLVAEATEDYTLTQAAPVNGIFALTTTSWVPHEIGVDVIDYADQLNDFTLYGTFSNRVILADTNEIQNVILAPSTNGGKAEYTVQTNIKPSQSVSTTIFVPIVLQPSTNAGIYLKVTTAITSNGLGSATTVTNWELAVKLPFSSSYETITTDTQLDAVMNVRLTYPDTFFSDTPGVLKIQWNDSINISDGNSITYLIPFLAKKVGNIAYAQTSAVWSVSYIINGVAQDPGDVRVIVYENTSQVLWDYAFANIDHHVPYCTYDAWKVSVAGGLDDNRLVRTQGQLVLNKPVYKPVFLRTDNVRSTVHYMYVGLFNLTVQKASGQRKDSNKKRDK